MKLPVRAALVIAATCLSAGAALAQDAVKVDPKHYSVLFENDKVRVLKIHYGPHETSKPHSHPDGVVTFLTDQDANFLLGDGKVVRSKGKAGTAQWVSAADHTPTNLS